MDIYAEYDGSHWYAVKTSGYARLNLLSLSNSVTFLVTVNDRDRPDHNSSGTFSSDAGKLE